MRVALVCDGFHSYGGAERTIEAILRIIPNADLFALVDFLPESARGWLNGRRVRTSFIQRIPGVRRHLRRLLPLWPMAIEQFDLSAYDLVISCQFAVAHGVLTHPHQVHIAYFHSPMRYAWDLHADHLEQAGLGFGPLGLAARYMLHRLRIWDFCAAQRPDVVVANSAFVGERIRRYYRRDSVTLHPPVFLDRFTLAKGPRDFYLSLGRLVPHKRIDVLIDAFAHMPDKRLVIAGTGPALARLKKAATTQNVSFAGEVDAAEADRLMGAARAYLHAAVEDFGIAPLEAQAAGTPVIAFGRGGLCETIVTPPALRPTGLFFDTQTPAAVIDAIERFEDQRSAFSPQACADNADRFSEEHFRARFAGIVDQALAGARRA